MSPRKITITLREGDGGVHIEMTTPPRMRDTIAEVLARFMCESAHQVISEFSAAAGLAQPTLAEWLQDPSNKERMQ